MLKNLDPMNDFINRFDRDISILEMVTSLNRKKGVKEEMPLEDRNAEKLRTIGVKNIGEGLYEICHWNFDQLLIRRLSYEQQYPLDSHSFEHLIAAGLYPLGSYGVCDTAEQFMSKFGDLLKEDPRHLVVSFTEVRKADQESHGGWRWHKWGAYVGEKEPQCEYLYDEPVIESVYCYHVYDVSQ